MAHGHCHSEHDHDHGEDPAVMYSLYQKIDMDKIQCLNEAEEGSGKTVFKPWDERLDRAKFVESDVDEELLFYIPFTGSVKLKGIAIVGGEEGHHPRHLKLFKNRPPLGFEELGGEADQTLELSSESSRVVEYPVKVAKFNGVSSILMYFTDNYGEETSKVYYIGLRGEFTKAQRAGIVMATYEARPNPADHKSKSHNPVSDFVS